MRTHQVLVILPAVLLLLSARPTLARYCVPAHPTNAAFCRTPPVVRNFDLTPYMGKWYQLYTSGTATQFSSNRCVTANYTLAADGTVSVVNCHLPSEEELPQCQRAVAERRVGLEPPHLQVQFAPFLPAGDYNVAALLGDAESGYEAAAVYTCRLEGDRVLEGVYFIARERERAEVVFEGLTRHMRCLGYVLDDKFYATGHEEQCRYFDGEKGFEEVDEFAGAE